MDKGFEYLIGERGLSYDIIEEFGLEYDEHFDSIRIPYRDGLGRIRSYRFRLFNPSPGFGKYHTPRGNGVHLYNIRDAEEHTVWITEGEIDCLTLKMYGFNAVGVPGAKAFMDQWKWLFAGSDVKICFDGDEDGKIWSRKLGRLLRPLASVEVIRPPEGKDINDLHVEGKLEEFLNGDYQENSDETE